MLNGAVMFTAFLPQPKAAESQTHRRCCEPALKNRKPVDVCECAGCSWGLAVLAGPKRFGEVVLIFYLNPRAEQNLRNGREGDKMS